MKQLKIFLASSNELVADRRVFEIEIGRKAKLWIDKGINIRLEIWEDLSSRMSSTRSQDEYTIKIKEVDLFVLIAYSKVGMYTEEEFETAFGTFQKMNKPFIFTYFKDIEVEKEKSLEDFKNKLKELGHFYSTYSDFNNLWIQFNKEMDRLLLADFIINEIPQNFEGKIDNRGNSINTQINNPTYVNPIIQSSVQKMHKAMGNIPLKPDVFLGRDNSVKEINDSLLKNKNLLLLVNGEGGIGKTTLAAQYYYTYYDVYKHLIWVVSKNGIKHALVSLAIPLGLSFPDQYDIYQQIDTVILEMNELSQPVLVIIDNANDRDDLENNLSILSKMHKAHIILTSRVNDLTAIENYKVGLLSEMDSIALFETHYPLLKEEEELLLKQILTATGYNTLVTELLSKNLAKLNDELDTNYPLQKLLEDIQSKGVLAISMSKEVNTQYSLTKAKPEEIIMAMYDVSKLSEEDKMILSALSVLPPVAILYDDLKILVGNVDMLAMRLKKLHRMGWLDYDKNVKSFRLSPVIAEVIRSKNHSIGNDISFLIAALIEKLDYEINTGTIPGDFEETLRFIAYAENVIVHKKYLESDGYVIFERVGNFYKSYGNLDKALKYFEEDLKISKELYESNSNNVGFKNGLAISYSKLGETQTSLGNLDKALKYFEDYLKISKELYESNSNNVGFKNGLAISYIKIGCLFMDNLNDESNGISYLMQARDLLKELIENFPQYAEFQRNYDWVINKIEGR